MKTCFHLFIIFRQEAHGPYSLLEQQFINNYFLQSFCNVYINYELRDIEEKKRGYDTKLKKKNAKMTLKNCKLVQLNKTIIKYVVLKSICQVLIYFVGQRLFRLFCMVSK